MSTTPTATGANTHPIGMPRTPYSAKLLTR
jgi:hypothetical protein